MKGQENAFQSHICSYWELSVLVCFLTKDSHARIKKQNTLLRTDLMFSHEQHSHWFATLFALFLTEESYTHHMGIFKTLHEKFLSFLFSQNQELPSHPHWDWIEDRGLDRQENHCPIASIYFWLTECHFSPPIWHIMLYWYISFD